MIHRPLGQSALTVVDSPHKKCVRFVCCYLKCFSILPLIFVLFPTVYDWPEAFMMQITATAENNCLLSEAGELCLA